MSSVEALQRESRSEVYSEIEGLSYSGMKALSVSPLRYWHDFINPNRPEVEETPAMRFGSALHCAVLEPSKFEKRYCRKLVKSEIPDCLDTMDDLREYASSKGLVIKERKKDAFIARILDHDPNAPIFDIIQMQWKESNSGKTALNQDEWERVIKASDALRSEPIVQKLTADGFSEHCVVAKDPSTGVILKGRLDWVTPEFTVDIKTFSATRGHSIDKCVNNAILYEKYHWQAYHYTNLRALSGEKKTRYVVAFVESEEPFEVRLRELKPVHGETNTYWQVAHRDVRSLTDAYAIYSRRFGKCPWRLSADLEVLIDHDLPNLSYF